MSETGPSELAKIIGSEESFRLYVVQKMEHLSGNDKLILAWQEAHDEKDNARFAAGERRMDKIEANANGVSSAVETEKDSNRYTLKELVIGFLGLCGALGALITFIAWAIGNAGKGAP